MDHTKIIGLDLLRNPNKLVKKKNMFIRKQGNLPKNVPEKTFDQKFKEEMINKIRDFKLPLENYEQADPLKIQIEACYYLYQNRNRMKK